MNFCVWFIMNNIILDRNKFFLFSLYCLPKRNYGKKTTLPSCYSLSLSQFGSFTMPGARETTIMPDLPNFTYGHSLTFPGLV